MRFRAHHLAASILFAGSIFLGSFAWLGTHTPAALASCPAGASVALGYPSGTTGTLSGNQNLLAHSTSTSTQPSGLTFVATSPTYVVLGQGVLGSGATWNLNWDSRSLPNGTYQMMAIAHYGTNTNLDCASPTVPFSVNNVPTQQPKLTAAIAPNGWEGRPSQSATFQLNGVYEDQFGRQSPLPSTAAIQWATTAGSLTNPTMPATILIAGAATGTFLLSAQVSYNGLQAKPTATIKVSATASANSGPGNTNSPSPSPSAGPAPTSGTDKPPLSAADVERLSTMPTIFRPTAPTNSNPVVAVNSLGCLEKAVGKTRFAEISSGQSQPTAAERRAAAECFSGSDRIPALLAPVEPTKIGELPTADSEVKLNGLKNTTVTNDKGEKVSAITINGTGPASSSIFLYIFSDPMVLRAETDSQGKWSYVLRNPLKPGDHEVYAVAEKDATSFVRTSAVPVSIAAAAPGSTDNSLVIESKWQPAQVGFAAGAAALMVAAIVILFRLRHRHHLVMPGTAGHPASAPATLVQPVSPTPLTSTPTQPPSNETKT